MRRGREVFVEPASFEWVRPFRGLLDNLEEVERYRPLLDLVEAMPEPQRSVVEMIGFGQIGKVETARQLGLSRQWVQRLWRKSRDELEVAIREMQSQAQDPWQV